MHDQLVEVMVSRPKAWKPCELCRELGVNAWELQRLIEKAKKTGIRIHKIRSEQVGNSYKYWVMA